MREEYIIKTLLRTSTIKKESGLASNIEVVTLKMSLLKLREVYVPLPKISYLYHFFQVKPKSRHATVANTSIRENVVLH